MLQGCTPWPDDLAARYRAKGYWQGITLPEMVARSAAKFPDKVALVDGARRLTYAELCRAVDDLACALVRQGLAPRERVVFQMPNSAEMVIVFLALLKAGVIPVMSLPAHRQAEIGHFLAHAEAVGYVIADRLKDFDYRAMAAELAPKCPSLRKIFVLGEPAGPNQIDLRALRAERTDPHEAAAILAERRAPAGEVALMLLSGGTTGIPKMIPRTHDDYVYICRISGEAMNLDSSAVYLALLQMAHNYTLIAPGFLGTFQVGGRVVIAPGTSADIVFPLIEAEGATLVATAPPLVIAWLAALEANRHDLSSLRVMTSGGARLGPEQRRRIEDGFGCTFVESFGTGEGLICQTLLTDSKEERMNGSGRPLSPDDDIRIVDDQDRDLPDGQRGELIVRGPYTIRGYYNAPAANKAGFTADGYYRMGDMVYRRDGTVYVDGRKKDLINRGGEKISTEEVENHILAHPAVHNAVVVAMPDPVMGEKACAFVIVKDGARFTFADLKAFLETRQIARFKWPERLELVEAYPLSPVGKILRRELREMIAATLKAEQASPGDN
ncbi:MAG: AMP-binding protein [Rhodospirillales bacterium]|nr:AMP-binding protein [Rhodospirillales bacterium]